MKNNEGRLYIHKVHTLRDCKIVRKIYLKITLPKDSKLYIENDERKENCFVDFWTKLLVEDNV